MHECGLTAGSAHQVVPAPCGPPSGQGAGRGRAFLVISACPPRGGGARFARGAQMSSKVLNPP